MAEQATAAAGPTTSAPQDNMATDLSAQTAVLSIQSTGDGNNTAVITNQASLGAANLATAAPQPSISLIPGTLNVNSVNYVRQDPSLTSQLPAAVSGGTASQSVNQIGNFTAGSAPITVQTSLGIFAPAPFEVDLLTIVPPSSPTNQTGSHTLVVVKAFGIITYVEAKVPLQDIPGLGSIIEVLFRRQPNTFNE
jgi:hypothetical protein